MIDIDKIASSPVQTVAHPDAEPGDTIFLYGPFRTPNPADIVACFDCDLFHVAYATSLNRLPHTPADDIHLLCAPCAHAVWPAHAAPSVR